MTAHARTKMGEAEELERPLLLGNNKALVLNIAHQYPMETLLSELEQIKVEAPSVILPSEENEVPNSYSSNNTKERVLSAYADNFQRQFRLLYGDRKPLLLKPLNECGIEKFVCTTLRPTYLPYKELYEFDSCAAFVADYLLYETLSPPSELPERVSSSTLVLKTQKGNCFEYANLLASLLIGVGYDAYCVCGYATQDVTLLNQIRKPCPQLAKGEQVNDQALGDIKKGGYSVKPPRDLTSQFEKRLENKAKLKIEEEERKKREEEAIRIAEAEAPPPDSYHGLRIHCWVLVLAGKREVAQSFYMEPTTGEDHPLDWDQYLGIETLWNHKNYWVNMQDCSQGVQNMSFDLGDATLWEFFFPDLEKPLLIVPGEQPELEERDGEEEDESDFQEDFQLPPSWVQPIMISPKDLETRCPRGCKQVLYYRAKVEKFAEYLNQDGLVSRVTSYDDTGRLCKNQIHGVYQYRKDCLQTRTESTKIGEVKDCFAPGRPRALKEHVHYESNPLRAANRTMLFYSHARVDCLYKREFTATEMIEHFTERTDFLYYRHTTYSKVPKSRTLDATLNKDTSLKPILKIVERFHRDPTLPANNDVAERVFLLEENKIHVSYHLEKDRITPSTREFITPTTSGDQGYSLHFDPDMTSTFQVDPYTIEPKNRHLFQQLEALLLAQEQSIARIRDSEKETEGILNNRMQEELNTTLSISVYDVIRNEAARTHRQELELKLAEEERIRKEKEMDYLAPFAARIGDPPTFSRQQMDAVSTDCLKDLRTRLVDMANIIQHRFEQETEELQKKQAWYKAKQGSLTKEEEKDYIDFCNDAMFRIHILEQRLNRHKITAPQKYRDLENRLRNDPRLQPIH